MRKSLTGIFMLVVLQPILSPIYTFAQWSTSGNTGATGQWLGTSNAYPLTIKTNNTERASFSTSGDFKVNRLSGTGNGLIIADNTGLLSRVNFSGTSTQVLTGAGTWAGIGSIAGWGIPGAGITATLNKVGIGITTPINALEVSGNGLFSGTVYAEHFIVGDASTVQGRLSFDNNLVMDGYDAIGGTRNEIHTIDQPLYLQSANLYNNDIIIGHGNTGKLGIGTDAPTAKFHVSGTSRFDGLMRTDSIQLGDSLVMKGGHSGGWSTLNFGQMDTSLGIFPPACVPMGTAKILQTVQGFHTTYSGTGSVIVGHNGTSAFIQSTGEDEAGVLKINDFCGNNVGICGSSGSGHVGIGTNAPETKLQVKTGAFSVSFGNALFAGLGYGTSYMGFNATRTGAGTWKTDTDSAHNGGAVLYSNVVGDVFLATIPDNGSGASGGQSGITDSAVLSQTRLYIAANGQTGIGTPCIPSGFKMAVDGKIICEGVKVKNSDSTGCWPDYVFDARYKPMSIEQLDAYVKTNKHLPGVPSEQQVAQQGVDLLELNKVMLKALEESNLYIIELKRENASIKKEMQELRQLIAKKR